VLVEVRVGVEGPYETVSEPVCVKAVFGTEHTHAVTIVAFEACRRPKAATTKNRRDRRLRIMGLANSTERPLVAEAVLANDFYEPGITFEILVVHRVVERGRVAFGAVAVAGAKQ